MKGDLSRIPEVMLKERAAQLGETPPEEVTLKVSKQLGLLLLTQAELYDRDVSYIARQALELWAEEWIRVTTDIYKALESAKVAKESGEEEPKKRNEHFYKCELAGVLKARGLNVRTEFHSGNGDADIAVMGADGKSVLAIIEVKLALRNWRECHHATGQARAYAEAVGAESWFVVAASIEDERFLKDGIHRFEDAADFIVAFVKKAA